MVTLEYVLAMIQNAAEIEEVKISLCALSQLRRLLKHFCKARKSQRTIDSIDTCLASGDVIELMKLRISENDEDQLKGTYYDTSNNKLPLRMEHLELVLYFQYATAHASRSVAVTSSRFRTG